MSDKNYIFLGAKLFYLKLCVLLCWSSKRLLSIMKLISHSGHGWEQYKLSYHILSIKFEHR